MRSNIACAIIAATIAGRSAARCRCATTTGAIVRWIGTCTDIHDAKRQAEQTEVLSRELSHRIKNIFAVVNGLIGLSVRRRPEAATFADDLRQRIWALGRAHEFARPHSEESRTGIGKSSLMGLLRADADDAIGSGSGGSAGSRWSCGRWTSWAGSCWPMGAGSRR